MRKMFFIALAASALYLTGCGNTSNKTDDHHGHDHSHDHKHDHDHSHDHHHHTDSADTAKHNH